ncbi:MULTISPECIES: hypothetical protein [unclassified Amycolatopsis]|nr:MULTISPECIES: hypothetical protein [unclassified Amycolatopsis]
MKKAAGRIFARRLSETPRRHHSRAGAQLLVSDLQPAGPTAA